MDKQQYTVTIVIAAPGTPLYKNGEQQVIDGEPANSGPGHMFFILDDSKSKPISYGFAPITHGEMNGPGKSITQTLRNTITLPIPERLK